MRRVLLLAAVIVTAILVESTVLGSARVSGARPDIVVLTVVAVAMASGPVSGAAYGFWAGLTSDLLLSGPVGVSALVYTIVGYAVGLVRVYVISPRAWAHIALATFASLASVWLTGTVLRVLSLSSWGELAKDGLLVAGWNLLLTPFVYPIVRVLAERVHAEKLYRW